MVRMSDILRKAKERGGKSEIEKAAGPPEKKRQKKEAAPPEPLKKEIPPEVKAPETKIQETQEDRVKIFSAVREIRTATDAEAAKLYEDTLSLLKSIMQEKIDSNSIDIDKLTQQTEKITNQISLGNEKLLMLSMTGDSLEPHYLPSHALNAAILSIHVGLGLGYEKPDLIKLGLCGFLYDIGMMKYLHLASEPRKLTADEYAEIKKHTVDGVKILENVKGIIDATIQSTGQHHERADGSGYPLGLKKESINEFASILGIVDTYEAMTHPRRYRDRRSPLETMREIVKNKSGFEQKVIKILIENMGFYPLGCLVELNTKEVARVIKLNRGNPLRPVVEVIYDAEGNKLKKSVMFDLLAKTGLYIKDCFGTEKEIKRKE